MNIPPKIKIGGHWIEVRQVHDREMATPTSGDYHQRWCEIRLAQFQEESEMAQTFLHEIVEYLNAMYELDLKHNQITAVSEGFFQVLRDNRLDFAPHEEEVRFSADILGNEP